MDSEEAIIEIYKGKPILYDTGDLIDDYMVSQYIDQQFLYFLHYSNGELEKIELRPVLLDYGTVNLAPDHVFQALAERMKERSKPFGTKIIIEKDRLIIPVENK